MRKKELISNMDWQDKSPKTSVSLFTRAITLLKELWSIRLFRFLLVGGINTIFGYCVYSLMILLNVHYAYASLLSTIVGVVFNFFTTGKIVFNQNNPRLIFKFIAVYGITYLINLGFLKIMDLLHINMLIAGVVVVIPNATIAYWLNKKIVFTSVNQPTK